MHQTIFGETHKVASIIGKKSINQFLENEKELINTFNSQTCIYDQKFTVNSAALNYLNYIPVEPKDKQLKRLIIKEFNDCESTYPYLGDYFLYKYFDCKNLKLDISLSFNRHHEKDIISSINNNHVKQIASWIFENTSIERNVSIERYHGSDVTLEIINDIVFNIDYDCDYIVNNVGMTIKNYNFIIIDGLIESVGEIHHLLHRANKSKEPYVIFCFGMAEEVKNVIIRNNSAGRTQVLPVVIDFNEETVNILNDIAVLHNDDVISALKGQTISQAIRKELKKGKRITFYKECLTIDPVCHSSVLFIHREMLRKYPPTTPQEKIDLIYRRIKRLSTKSLKIYVPIDVTQDNNLIRELHYFLTFLKNMRKKCKKVSGIKIKEYTVIPDIYLEYADEKVNSLKNTFYNIEKLILIKENKKE